MTAHDATRPLDAALAYADRGWLVFPCHSPIALGCSCRRAECSSPGKHPRVAGGLKAASHNTDAILRWWNRWPHANVGVRTGAESGLVVIDVDPRHGGLQSLELLLARHRPARGPVVRTGSGGMHLFFRHPGEPVRNTAGALGGGLDVRGDGGYVVAPPSRHATGHLYRWLDAESELPQLPESLLARMRARRTDVERAREPIRLDEAVSAWARAALEGEATRVRSAAQGTRNATLNRAAFCLGQIVGSGVLDQPTVERVLATSALASGLGETEAAATIRSGMRAGIEHPRGPAARRIARTSTEPAVRPEVLVSRDVIELPP